MKKKNFEKKFWKIIWKKENVQFPDSPNFENLPDLRTRRDVRLSLNWSYWLIYAASKILLGCISQLMLFMNELCSMYLGMYDLLNKVWG